MPFGKPILADSFFP